ncbi:Winged helix DNA-binding domain-containing protein [Sulfidibacter corallicola]|uniref:Winged helix DNA-binding domain-containing protein n=1 Tax=Sulfidibacter corallicola TaxID=2818388 RepID=A0A8A4TU55_SULCO|nr:crosslink repair DNA glycosylase YcaQ family protein [Sulfidibacter corallicola]QTD53003.1 winged helix DNA-binding domain-containing protein [Sulfidibacter corallicola]
MVLRISKDEARRYMLSQLVLNRFAFGAAGAGLVDLLRHLRCIQIDPLSPMGSSPDMVVLARTGGADFSSLFGDQLRGKGFEHFAKERCWLPAEAFPYYRAFTTERNWWGETSRRDRVPPETVAAVLDQVTREGPLTPADLDDYGKIQPLNYSGWKSTGKAGTMALEILWSRCQVVVIGKRGKDKLYDIPSRALPEHHQRDADDSFARWGIRERVEACGLLPRAGGPHWSVLSFARQGEPLGSMLAEGEVVEVRVEGSSRPFLAPRDFMARPTADPDEHLRILAPLDPLLWDRKLVKQIFGFDYVWEVYKPIKKRIWGWYVCPLLQGGRLVGRLEGRCRDGVLHVDRVWREQDVAPDSEALDQALARHARACGARDFKRPKRFLANP